MYTINLCESKWLIAVLLRISAKDCLMYSQTYCWSKEARNKMVAAYCSLLCDVSTPKKKTQLLNKTPNWLKNPVGLAYNSRPAASLPFGVSK